MHNSMEIAITVVNGAFLVRIPPKHQFLGATIPMPGEGFDPELDDLKNQGKAKEKPSIDLDTMRVNNVYSFPEAEEVLIFLSDLLIPK